MCTFILFSCAWICSIGFSCILWLCGSGSEDSELFEQVRIRKIIPESAPIPDPDLILKERTWRKLNIFCHVFLKLVKFAFLNYFFLQLVTFFTWPSTVLDPVRHVQNLYCCLVSEISLKSPNLHYSPFIFILWAGYAGHTLTYLAASNSLLLIGGYSQTKGMSTSAPLFLLFAG